MEFELSGDQEALRDAARDLLSRRAPIERVRQLVDRRAGTGQGGDAGDFDPELWSALVDQGWPVVELPEDRGGLGLGMVEVALLCEQLGRFVAPTPFAGHVLALDALSEVDVGHGLPAAARDGALRWTERLADGTALGCVAWSERPLELDERVGGPAMVTGRPEPTIFASVADAAVVVAPDGVWLVDLDEVGRPQPEPAMDLTRSVAWLRLDRTPALPLGERGTATHILDRAAATTSAELLGACDRALELSVDYAGERVQFGKPIGSFQAVKHRLADMFVDVEGMRSSVYFAAWSLATRDPDASLACSSAKAWCSDAARRVMASALQVHGGIGFTWEHDLHLYAKRAELDAVVFGDAPYHRERIAQLLVERPAGAPGLF